MPTTRLKIFAVFVSVCTFFLLIAGALVTSTGSGLAVPDWPLSFGTFFPPMTGGVLFEHGHRMIAGTVGILTMILTFWTWKKESRRWICRLASAALGAVVLQALLGGLTVLMKLPPQVSIAHAILAQTFFCLTVAIAYFMNSEPVIASDASDEAILQPEIASLPSVARNDIKIFSIFNTVLIYLQLILGAAVRHFGSSFALNLHAALAGILVISNIAFFIALRNEVSRDLKYLSGTLLGLFAVQVILGLFSAFPMIIPIDLSWLARTLIVTSHVALGALILAVSLFITLNLLSAGRRFIPRELVS